MWLCSPPSSTAVDEVVLVGGTLLPEWPVDEPLSSISISGDERGGVRKRGEGGKKRQGRKGKIVEEQVSDADTIGKMLYLAHVSARWVLGERGEENESQQ